MKSAMTAKSAVDSAAKHRNPHQDGVVSGGSKVAGTKKKNKITYILALALLCSVVSTCSAQTPPGVNGFQAASWNSAGGRWSLRNNYISVQLLLTNYGIDVLALQEAGSLDGANLPPEPLPATVAPGTAMNILFLGGAQGELEFRDYNPGVTERVWRIGQQDYYIYYYDRNIANADLHPNVASRPPAENRRINIAIVSKYKATQVIVIEPVVSTVAKTNVNRPILGILVRDSFFFSLHPEPSNTANEAPLMINSIQNFMANDHPTLTWMAMGDFNRTPQDLMSARNLIAPPPNFFREAVTTGQATRTRELDYAVVGGPSNYFIRNGRTVKHTAVHFTQKYPTINNPSDHSPVIYKKP